ncbi:hypothetical protein IDJ77_26620 [Mucilaginibacter sp. ZT4R22]|uniref:Uncharacterized protein n=1 Tax=Mucilaginibacter pankratovii TaxID=2772110 RepID=A0ABR7WZ01_9SPHI|nr:hypothetical protein [Mucilaginibacter pankratovii]MBD1367413.1 hypothetical protein [Mucilaginibacter pankratovii]
MERLTIQVPEKKSKLVKSLLKELGVIVETEAQRLVNEFDSRNVPGEVPSMDEIVEEIRLMRAEKSR